MWSLEFARKLAEATGRIFPTAEQIIHRILRDQGLTRSQRRKLVAALKGRVAHPDEPEGTPE